MRAWVAPASSNLTFCSVAASGLLDIRISTHPHLTSSVPYHTFLFGLTSLDPSHLSSTVTMLRTGAVRAFYAATRTQIPRQLPAFRAQISYPLQHASRSIPSFVVPSVRCYSASAGLTKDEVQGRIFDVLKNFDKVRLSCQNLYILANSPQVSDVSKVMTF